MAYLVVFVPAEDTLAVDEEQRPCVAQVNDGTLAVSTATDGEGLTKPIPTEDASVESLTNASPAETEENTEPVSHI